MRQVSRLQLRMSDVWPDSRKHRIPKAADPSTLHLTVQHTKHRQRKESRRSGCPLPPRTHLSMHAFALISAFLTPLIFKRSKKLTTSVSFVLLHPSLLPRLFGSPASTASLLNHSIWKDGHNGLGGCLNNPNSSTHILLFRGGNKPL